MRGIRSGTNSLANEVSNGALGNCEMRNRTNGANLTRVRNGSRNVPLSREQSTVVENQGVKGMPEIDSISGPGDLATGGPNMITIIIASWWHILGAIFQQGQ